VQSLLSRIKQILFPFRQDSSKIKVYALVGQTGTGKSFRSKLLADKYNIDLIIDDGLIIRGKIIIAGKSAKRETNRFKAIKRAIFEDFNYAKEMKQVLTEEKFNSILLIGTSEKMVGRIAERLDLPYPDEIIYIEDLATREEIANALESRRIEGKHVIPVPMIEVRKDPAHRILDSIRFFIKNHPIFIWKNKVVEKTIVQPLFSRRGQLSISQSALSQMVMHCVLEYNPEITIKRIFLDPLQESFRLEVKLCVPYGLNIPKVLTELQDYIINNVEKYSGIHIDSLNLVVDVLKKKSNFHK
jgi:adenylate kinase family enzyme